MLQTADTYPYMNIFLKKIFFESVFLFFFFFGKSFFFFTKKLKNFYTFYLPKQYFVTLKSNLGYYSDNRHAIDKAWALAFFIHFFYQIPLKTSQNYIQKRPHNHKIVIKIVAKNVLCNQNISSLQVVYVKTSSKIFLK